VVDWGFAKVLAQGGVADERRARKEAAEMTRIATVRTGSTGSDSIAGSVLGTPAYMPPEQALGQVDDMDERSDVFALGAILCEILTGEPPYLGDGNQRLRQAAEGKLEDALARLTACDADPGLVRLAKKCLAPLRRDRPRNAGVVARGLARHLAAVEERAKKAQIAALDARREAAKVSAETAEEMAEAEQVKANAAKQRAKLERNRARAERAREAATEARRARRRALLVAGAAVLVVLVGAGVVLAVLGGRAEHARQTEGRVDALLERATVLQGREQWAEALAVLDEAESVARSGGVTETASPRVAAVRGDVERARAEAAALAAATEADRKLVASLEAVRLGETSAKTLATAFAKAGIRPRGRDAEKQLARHEAVAEAVAAALDEWAWLRSQGPERQRLLGLATGIDPDPDRMRLRRAAAEENVRVLLEMAAADESDPRSERTVDLVALGLLSTRKPEHVEAADALLRRALLRMPGSPWLNLRRALTQMRLPIPRPSDAARHLEAVIALRPRSAGPRQTLERIRRQGSDLDAFRAVVGFRNPAEWFTVDLTWSRITGRQRKIYVNKGAVTQALVDYRDEGVGEEANPMVYPGGTFFVAETFDREGKLFQTEAIRIDWPQSKTTFFVFDEDGRRTNRFFRHSEMAPRVCASCHMADPKGYYPPMMNYPDEPEESRIEIEEKYRDPGLVLKFLEGKHCGSNVFGPYAAMWLSKLRTDARNKQLSVADRDHFRRLRQQYGYLLDR
jgi:tetratricopeptide (TPR) repeat protein